MTGPVCLRSFLYFSVVFPVLLWWVPESNWLPSAQGRPFSLTFRTYIPRDVVKHGGRTRHR